MIESSDRHPWLKSLNQIVLDLGSDLKQGLSSEEAEHRLEINGLNDLPPPQRESVVGLFLNQFKSLMVGLLLAASLISGLLGNWVDTGVIVFIVGLNAIIGFFQEYRAAQALEALKRATRVSARVVRDGQEQMVDASYLVPGDLVVLEGGDGVPADGRLVMTARFSTQEASLTGESQPVEKTAETIQRSPFLALGDRSNMVYRGTFAASGVARVVVTHTGVHTEIGKIALSLSRVKEETTPLQLRLEEFGRQLVLGALAIIAVIALAGWWRGLMWQDLIMTSLSLAVAAVPEGLPAVVTIALSFGMHTMAKHRAIMTSLPATETLGCTTVICTDKTGTLTQNAMTVRRLYVDGEWRQVTGRGYSVEGEIQADLNSMALKRLLATAALCNEAGISHKDEGWEVRGDPMEAALLVLAAKAGEAGEGFQVTDKIPFNSVDKQMSVRTADGWKLTKGAPEVLIPQCQRQLLSGREVVLSVEDRERLLKEVEQMASHGLRLLAFAQSKEEGGSCFLGLTAMEDPPREEVAEAVRLCRQAGIQPVMVTGDHPATAAHIGREVGLLSPGGRVVTERELSGWSSPELDDEIRKVEVFARVSPQTKERIVESYRRLGQVVAMTGDGVNDAPALQKADIGIAMGKTGTEVAKAAADMVIVDDNFATIVKAVEAGRTIYANIVKTVSYLISCNFAELLILFISMLFFPGLGGDHAALLLPIHLLWINVVTDGFPALALAFDPVSPEAMNSPPRHPATSLIPRPLAWRLVVVSGAICLGTLVCAFLAQRWQPGSGSTAAFTVLVGLELMKSFVIRARYRLSPFSNSWLLGAVALCASSQVAVVQIPWAQGLFHTEPLGAAIWGTIVVILGVFYVTQAWVMKGSN